METNSISGIGGTTPTGSLETVREYATQVKERDSQEAVDRSSVQNQSQDETRGVNLDVKV